MILEIYKITKSCFFVCLFVLNIASMDSSGPGSIAHHGSMKCIHLNPANRLVIRTGCYRKE